MSDDDPGRAPAAKEDPSKKRWQGKARQDGKAYKNKTSRQISIMDNPTKRLDFQKQKLHPGLTLLEPGSLSTLMVFKRQMHEALALRFKYNGRLLERSRYFSHEEALAATLEMTQSIVAMTNAPKKTSAAAAAASAAAAAAAAARDDDDAATVSGVSGHDDEDTKVRTKVEKFFKAFTPEQREEIQRNQLQQALKISNEAYMASVSGNRDASWDCP